MLDDDHAIEAPAIHEAVVFLQEPLPPRVHLVIAGRVHPRLPLARVRARGQLAEIRAAELRVTPDEAVAFFREVMGLAPTAVAVAALEERTEGWVAGLQLAALARQGSTDIPGFIAAFAGRRRYIVDYLADEAQASTASWECIRGPRPSPALTPSRSSNTALATTSDDRSSTCRRAPSCRLETGRCMCRRVSQSPKAAGGS